MKKAFALFLALVLLLTVFVLPASATLEASPYATRLCPTCMVAREFVIKERTKQISSYTVTDGSCPYDSYIHPHYISELFYDYTYLGCNHVQSVSQGVFDYCITEP